MEPNEAAALSLTKFMDCPLSNLNELSIMTLCNPSESSQTRREQAQRLSSLENFHVTWVIKGLKAVRKEEDGHESIDLALKWLKIHAPRMDER